jgi:hypothetical protein
MTDKLYGPLLSFHDVELALRDHVEMGIDAYLAARERKVGLTEGTIPRPKSYVIKQTFTSLPGEESTPSIIVISDGMPVSSERHGDGRHDIAMHMAVVAFVYAEESAAVRTLAGNYQAALLGLLMKHKTIMNGQAYMFEFVSMRMEDLDEEAVGRAMCAVRLEFLYAIQDFADEYNPPPWPPVEPPYAPLPDNSTVQSVDVQSENVLPNEEVG